LFAVAIDIKILAILLHGRMDRGLKLRLGTADFYGLTESFEIEFAKAASMPPAIS
jgi:hypothetical protein